jgi:hypothetical protein
MLCDESGYKIEDLIVGNHNKEYWKKPEIFLDINRWNSHNPVFSD